MKTQTTQTRTQGRVTVARRGRTSGVRRLSKSGVRPAPVVAPFEIKSILVPVDFSASSGKALDYAVAFARQFGARLTLLHVLEPVAAPDFAQGFPLMMENDKAMAALKARLELLVKQKAIESRIVEKTLVRQGRSFHEIADAAQTLKVDVIIISTHGYTGLKHTLLGSTTERVVRHAPCPVLVVRERERQFLTG